MATAVCLKSLLHRGGRQFNAESLREKSRAHHHASWKKLVPELK
jgi:hypothetical protein